MLETYVNRNAVLHTIAIRFQIIYISFRFTDTPRISIAKLSLHYKSESLSLQIIFGEACHNKNTDRPKACMTITIRIDYTQTKIYIWFKISFTHIGSLSLLQETDQYIYSSFT